MSVHGQTELPTEVHALLARYERNIQQRDRLTVGELFAAIDRQVDVDPAITEQRLLAIVAIGKDLLRGAICHEGMSPSGLEQAREMAGGIIDAVLSE